jgi:hypothetical protein
MESYKLHIKVGPHEFQGEGSEEAVKKSFEEWKLMIASAGPSPDTNPDSTRRSDSGGVLEEAHIARLYLLDEKKKRGLVTLRLLPRGEDRDPDAVLLILLGFGRMRDQIEVPVTQLKPALKQSGCNVDRVDAVVAKYLREGLLNKGGSGKGGKYSLTNSGTQKAISLALGLLS